MFKVNNRNTRTRCEICSKLTVKTPERRQWRRFVVFIVNIEHILHLVLVFLLLTLKMQMSIGKYEKLISILHLYCNRIFKIPVFYSGVYSKVRFSGRQSPLVTRLFIGFVTSINAPTKCWTEFGNGTFTAGCGEFSVFLEVNGTKFRLFLHTHI